MASLSTLCSFGVAMTLLCSGVLAGAPDESKARAPLEVVEDYDVPPKAVHVTRPVYPPTALEQGIEGTVERGHDT